MCFEKKHPMRHPTHERADPKIPQPIFTTVEASIAAAEASIARATAKITTLKADISAVSAKVAALEIAIPRVAAKVAALKAVIHIKANVGAVEVIAADHRPSASPSLQGPASSASTRAISCNPHVASI